MRTIGSRQAADLARKKFGDHAFAMRQGRVFKIGTTGHFLFWNTHFVAGIGKSWKDALQGAGIHTPNQMVEELGSIKKDVPPTDIINGMSDALDGEINGTHE